MDNISAQAKKHIATVDLLRSVAWGLLALYVVVLLVAQQFVVGVFVVSQSEKSQILSQQFQSNEHLLSSIQEISNKKTSAEVVEGMREFYQTLGLTLPPLEVVELGSASEFLVRETQKKSRTSF